MSSVLLRMFDRTGSPTRLCFFGSHLTSHTEAQTLNNGRARWEDLLIQEAAADNLLILYHIIVYHITPYYTVLY